MNARLLRLLLALLRVWLVLVLACAPAWAGCSMSTLTLPDGRVIMCQTCCLPDGFCQTQCM